MSAEIIASPPDGRAVGHDLRHLDKVRGIFASLAKFVNARAIYQSNNPHYIRTAQAFEQSFRSYFETDPELLLTVAQYQLIWREQVVYDTGCNTESIAFLLYKDGIGEITIHAAVTRAELDQFAGILMSALYSPSSQFDSATAFWEAEFASIFYRVLDEQTDGAGGGDGSGSGGREQPLRANDHQDLSARDTGSPHRHSDSSLETLGSYFTSLAEDGRPKLDAAQRELRLQSMLATHLTIDAGEQAAWGAGPRVGHDGDELIAFLRIILEFTRMRCTPPVIRDVNDTIERMVHYIRDEGHIATLTATLELLANLDIASLEAGFASLPDRIEAELTDSAYLLSLAQGFRTSNSPHDVLRYLSLAGENAVPGLCELMARSSDASIHEKACDVLLAAVGDDVHRVVDQFNVENPLLAGDAVHLLSRTPLATIPAVIHRMLASQDARIRRIAIDYLVHAGSEEAARLACALLKDGDAGVRIRAFASMERLKCPLVINEVTSLCLDDDPTLKSSDELEHMFRALGKVAGIDALPRLRQMVEKKHYLGTGKARSKRDKLCAISALRYIPGEESRHMLERLARDGDSLVKTKAVHVLKQVTSGLGSDVYERMQTPVPGEEQHE